MKGFKSVVVFLKSISEDDRYDIIKRGVTGEKKMKSLKQICISIEEGYYPLVIVEDFHSCYRL